MKKIYLFGASINCKCAMDFLGKDNIIAIIDNNVERQGTEWLGVEIISLDEYIQRADGGKIFVTSFYHSEEVIQNLKEKGITNYQKCPWMQSGYFASADKVIDALGLEKKRTIAFYDRNPIAEKIADSLIKRNPLVDIVYISPENLVDLQAEVYVLLTINESEEEKELLKSKYGEEFVCDVEKIYMESYRFKNLELRRFKDIHKGKRCFVLGNGPSLRMEDLDLLHEKKEICFAGNSIYRAYKDTDWRPDYYVAVDSLMVEALHEEINQLESTCFINHFNGKDYGWTGDNIYLFGIVPNTADNVLFSYDIAEKVYNGYSLVYVAIQIALYMGFTEIYLLGVDASWGGKMDAHHFYGSGGRQVDDLVKGVINQMPMRNAIGVAGKAVAKAGGTLKNATRGGELEEIERVDFDSLF